MKDTLIKILPYVVIALLVFFYVKGCNDNAENIAVTRQNYLAQVNKLKQINDSTYQRYVHVSDSLNDKLIGRDEMILAQSDIIVQLRNSINNTVGTVIKDTVFVEVPTSCIGLRLGFSADNGFYSYTDTVTVDNPPKHKLSLAFKPLHIKTFLTRNKEGVWSGFMQFSDNAKKYLTAESFDVEVAKDLYLESFTTRFSLVPFFSIASNGTLTNFNLGAMGIISDRHLIGYGKSINSKFHTVMYGYKFNL